MKKGLRVICVLFLGLALTGQTVRGADYFTELFFVDYYYGYYYPFDLDNFSITFTPNTSGSGYSVNGTPITALPTGEWHTHTTVPLGDDNYYRFDLLSGKTVKLYGHEYSEVYIGSNGYITFLSGDDDRSPTFTEHFSQPRISAFYDDLDTSLSGGGTVLWKQLADRAVVTFVGVPEWYGTEGNTFQTEMFFDGRIRISWLDMPARYGLVGLSEGTGVPADFVMSNLSGYEWDFDFDGMPNWWEVQYFFGETNCVAGDDADGDDQTNLDEFVAGTHPHNAGSYFRISESSMHESGGDSHLVFSWNSVPGRDYRVWKKDHLRESSATLMQSGITYPVNSYTAATDYAESGYYTLEVEMSE